MEVHTVYKDDRVVPVMPSREWMSLRARAKLSAGNSHCSVSRNEVMVALTSRLPVEAKNQVVKLLC